MQLNIQHIFLIPNNINKSFTDAYKIAIKITQNSERIA